MRNSNGDNGHAVTPVDYENVANAVYTAIIRKEFTKIDDIINNNVGALTRVKHSKTPLFEGVESVLISAQNLDGNDKHLATGLIAEGLNHIFKKVQKKLASPYNPSDRQLLFAFVDKACNHMSHTSMFSRGATLRDILERYCGQDLSVKPKDGCYADLHDFVTKYDLKQSKEVIKENLTAKGQSITERGL
jgi:hypothetical protein